MILRLLPSQTQGNRVAPYNKKSKLHNSSASLWGKPFLFQTICIHVHIADGFKDHQESSLIVHTARHPAVLYVTLNEHYLSFASAWILPLFKVDDSPFLVFYAFTTLHNTLVEKSGSKCKFHGYMCCLQITSYIQSTTTTKLANRFPGNFHDRESTRCPLYNESHMQH